MLRFQVQTSERNIGHFQKAAGSTGSFLREVTTQPYTGAIFLIRRSGKVDDLCALFMRTLLTLLYKVDSSGPSEGSVLKTMPPHFISQTALSFTNLLLTLFILRIFVQLLPQLCIPCAKHARYVA